MLAERKTPGETSNTRFLVPRRSWWLHVLDGGEARRSSMPSATRIAELQAENFAEDVEVPPEAAGWSEDRLVAFLESGGVESSAQGSLAAPLGRRARVACLHGTAGNERIFTIQASRLKLALKAAGADSAVYEGTEVIAAENPHGAAMRKIFGDQVLREYAPALLDEAGRRTYEPAAAEAAVADLEARIAGAGGCDAVLGFSQGANFASMLAARAAAGVGPLATSLRCVVLLAPARPGWPHQDAWKRLFAAPLPVPALVVRGASDTVSAEGPVELVAHFRGARLVEHKEGHRPLPADRAAADGLIRDICSFVLERCPP